MTIEVGRMIVKIAGRDGGKKAVIIDILDNNYVLIDGETRRRKCNVMHLEPLNEVIEISKNALHDEVAKAFEKLGLKARETKPKEKKEKPKQKRKTPEQLKAQKEEKKKLRDLFKIKKKEETAETALEEKAGIEEQKQIEPVPQHGLVLTPVEEHSLATQKKEVVGKKEEKLQKKVTPKAKKSESKEKI